MDNIPTERPAINCPTKRIGMLIAAAWIAEPTRKTRLEYRVDQRREKRSAMGPLMNAPLMAPIVRTDTIHPWRVASLASRGKCLC